MLPSKGDTFVFGVCGWDELGCGFISGLSTASLRLRARTVEVRNGVQIVGGRATYFSGGRERRALRATNSIPKAVTKL